MAASSSIVLVGGAPGVGKTTLARHLARRIDAVPVTVDDAQAAVIAATTAETHPAFHHMDATGGHVRYFTETPPDRLVADSVEREQAMWPVVQALVRSHRGRGSSAVMDWWLLRPSDVVTLDDVESVWVHLDPDALWDRERRNSAWTAGSADAERMLANFMARSRWRNDLVAEQATAHGLPLVRLAGDESPHEVADLAEAALAQARVS